MARRDDVVVLAFAVLVLAAFVTVVIVFQAVGSGR